MSHRHRPDIGRCSSDCDEPRGRREDVISRRHQRAGSAGAPPQPMMGLWPCARVCPAAPAAVRRAPSQAFTSGAAAALALSLLLVPDSRLLLAQEGSFESTPAEQEAEQEQPASVPLDTLPGLSGPQRAAACHGCGRGYPVPAAFGACAGRAERR
jgi:hypothetical protein